MYFKIIDLSVFFGIWHWVLNNVITNYFIMVEVMEKGYYEDTCDLETKTWGFPRH